MTLTEKDRKLLTFVGIAFAILALVLYVIVPGFRGFKDNNAKIDTLKVQKQTMQTEIEALPTYKEQLKTSISDYNTTAKRVYGDLTNDLIHDEVINNFMVAQGLSVSSFSIKSINEVSLQNFENVEDENGKMVGKGGIDSENPTIRLANITVNGSGNENQVVALLNQMNNTEGIYVQNASISNSDASTSVAVTFNMVLSETYK